jgi:hypothetical protein
MNVAFYLYILLTARGSGVMEQANKRNAAEKRIKELPRLTEALKSQLQAWQIAEGAPVRQNGKRYVDIIEVHTASQLNTTSVSTTARTTTTFDSIRLHVDIGLKMLCEVSFVECTDT